MRKTLYVGNLASHQSPGEVEKLLSRAGKVLHSKMMVRDDMAGRHGGFVIAEMENESDAIQAARTLHGILFQGNRLEVRPATAMEETDAGHPRMFGTMNMADDPVKPDNA